MKQFLRIIYLVAFLAVSFRGAAYDAEAVIDDLHYGLDTSAGTATVLPGDYVSTSALTIPSEVAYDGRTYTVTAIADYAFRASQFTSITIPASINAIGHSAFLICHSLEEIIVDEANNHYKDVGGVLLTKDGSVLIQFPIAKSITEYDIPYGVVTIGVNACNCCKLESVTFPETVVNIGDQSFNNCVSMKSISLPPYLKRIGEYAFSNNTILTTLTIPGEVAEIGESAFYGCHRLQSVEIPASVLKIGCSAFSSCRSLKQISVDKENEHYCSTGGVLFSKDMKSLLVYPAGCGAENYEIPATVMIVYDEAFQGCSNLKEIHIPESVTTIGNYTFWNCNSLSKIYCQPINPPICARLFNKAVYDVVRLFVPEESIADYRAHSEWGKFVHINDASWDYSVRIDTDGQCVHGDKWRLNLAFGADVAYSKVTAISAPYPYYTDNNTLIENTISNGSSISALQETLSVRLNGVVDHTSAFVVFVSFDRQGNPQESDVAECVIDGSDDSWETLDGLGHFTDGYMCRIYPDRADGIKDYDVTVQRSKTAPGCFRVVNPYPYGEWGNCSCCVQGDHYLYIDATNPDKVYVKASALGIGFGKDSGSMLMFTGNAYIASFYDDLETTDVDYGTMDKNGFITLKDRAILGKENSDPYNVLYDDEAYITLQLPASYSSGIDAVIEDGAEAPVEYYNLQGIRVYNVEGTSGIYIRRQGNKTTKVYVK